MKIKEVVVLVKLDNRTIHQVLLSKEDSRVILSIISQLNEDKVIRLHEPEIEGVDFGDHKDRLDISVEESIK